MKNILLAFCMILHFINFAQKDFPVRHQGDSTVSKASVFLSNLLYVNPNQKHHHIIDRERGDPTVTYGYNYYYQINPSLRVGARVGVDTYIAKEPLFYGDRIMPFKIEGLVSYQIFRSIYGEIGLGYTDYQNLTTNNGSEGSFVFRGGVNVSIFRFLFIRSGLSISHHKIPQFKVYSQFSASIGLKF